MHYHLYYAFLLNKIFKKYCLLYQLRNRRISDKVGGFTYYLILLDCREQLRNIYGKEYAKHKIVPNSIDTYNDSIALISLIEFL